MKRRAVACEWGTPQTKRSVTGQSQPSSPLDPFQDYIVQNYHAVTSYRLGHINSLFISTPAATQMTTRSTTCSRTQCPRGRFAATASNPSARPSTASASATPRSALPSATARTAATPPAGQTSPGPRTTGPASASKAAVSRSTATASRTASAAARSASALTAGICRRRIYCDCRLYFNHYNYCTPTHTITTTYPHNN